MENSELKRPEDYFNIIITSESVTIEHPQRKTESIRWTDIEVVKIITTDQGPFQPDVWYALIGKESGCLIPQGANGHQQIYDTISKYEGFDFENVIASMMSTENAEFLVWVRGNPTNQFESTSK